MPLYCRQISFTLFSFVKWQPAGSLKMFSVLNFRYQPLPNDPCTNGHYGQGIWFSEYLRGGKNFWDEECSGSGYITVDRTMTETQLSVCPLVSLILNNEVAVLLYRSFHSDVPFHYRPEAVTPSSIDGNLCNCQQKYALILHNLMILEFC